MKSKIFLFILLLAPFLLVNAQEEESEVSSANKPVRSMFNSSLLIDNQSVIVPMKGTFQFDINHRFGTLENGFSDMLGLYSPSNIRLGFTYAPINNLSLGFGFTKVNELLDFSAKYALFEQTRSGSIPVSMTYYGNVVMDSRATDETEVYHTSDRYSFFHQLIIARKVSNKLSIQVAPSLSHFNIIGEEREPNKHDHIAIAFGGKLNISAISALIVNVDQPITKHEVNNPNPNVSFGIEISTSSHAFQIFLGNYTSLVPQYNNVFNNYNWKPDDGSDLSFFDNFKENFRIGFNVTRLWNF